MKQTHFVDAPEVTNYEFKGLAGRYGHWPANRTNATRTFVLVYGQHATIERLKPIIETLQNYGDVYLADNPGFGGMDSPYKIKAYPDLDFYAQHLKNFIDRYVDPSRQLTLVGVSYGFQMLVEFLHSYPMYCQRVEQLISFVGFVSHKDFNMPKRVSIPLMYMLCNSGRTKLGAALYDRILNERLIMATYKATKPIQAKFKNLDGDEAKQYAREQAWLWLVNDNRTHGVTAWDFFKKTDLTAYRIDVEAIHIGVPKDHLLRNHQIEDEMSRMFSTFTAYSLHLDNHAPLDLDTAKKVQSMLPKAISDRLNTSVNETAVAA